MCFCSCARVHLPGYLAFDSGANRINSGFAGNLSDGRDRFNWAADIAPTQGISVVLLPVCYPGVGSSGRLATPVLRRGPSGAPPEHHQRGRVRCSDWQGHEGQGEARGSTGPLREPPTSLEAALRPLETPGRGEAEAPKARTHEARKILAQVTSGAKNE